MNPSKRVGLVLTLSAFSLLALTFAQSGAPSFRVIALPNDGERVTAVYCSSAKACVIATGTVGQPGRLYASDGQKITRTLLTGDEKLAGQLGTLGTVGFTGFSKVGNRLIVLVDGAGGSFVSATGDITQPASWSALKIGKVEGSGTFGLNQQMGFGVKDSRWVHFTFRSTYESSDAPGPGALWTPLWSPIPPSVPSNFAELRRADPKLCDADPGVTISPHLTQPAYVAPDLSVILYPAGARNQRGSSAPGVCISTDGGKRFSSVPFAGVPEGLGPLGVTCASSSRCFAYGGVDSAPESVYVYASSDAHKGAASTWTNSKLPSLRTDSKFRGLGFAPDGKNGWLVGTSGAADALLFSSTDGGASWKDATSSIRALVSTARLHTVYAFDATHVWVGGERGALLTTGN
jgi:Photosynthesis system II assembly factor YCF48